MKISKKIILLFSILAITSCAAMSTAISKRNLDVQTKMSNTIFLDPVADNQKTIFLQIRNTSDKPEFSITNEIKEKMIAKGYKVVNDPDKAHYILQANILQVGKTSQTAAEKSLMGGYGDAMAGAVAGAFLGGRNGSTGGAVAGGLIGAGIAFVANSMVEDVYYSITTDLQISEKAKKGVKVTNQSNQNLAQGNSGSTKSTYQETSDSRKYQTRVLSFANKVNLKWEAASPELVKGLSASIAGMF
jgi:outer membrane lipoprotein SlyB